MPDADFESGLVDGLVKAREGFSGMSRGKLCNTKKPRKEENKGITNSAQHLIHGCANKTLLDYCE